MLDFDIACLLTFVVYRKNDLKKEAFSLSNGPCADIFPRQRNLNNTSCIWKLRLRFVYVILYLFGPRGPYIFISHQNAMLCIYIHLNPSLIYPISSISISTSSKPSQSLSPNFPASQIYLPFALSPKMFLWPMFHHATLPSNTKCSRGEERDQSSTKLLLDPLPLPLLLPPRASCTSLYIPNAISANTKNSMMMIIAITSFSWTIFACYIYRSLRREVGSWLW
jgi:hypothetical protein